LKSIRSGAAGIKEKSLILAAPVFVCWAASGLPESCQTSLLMMKFIPNLDLKVKKRLSLA
jgi:hypothetical protein